MASEPHDEDITLTGELSLADILAGGRAQRGPAERRPLPFLLEPLLRAARRADARRAERDTERRRARARASAGTIPARRRRSPIAGSPRSIATASAASMLIASLPGDEGSVAAAVARHPGRIVGGFMVNPVAPDGAIARALRARRRRPARRLPVPRDAPVLAVRSQGRRGRRRSSPPRRARCSSCTAACCRSACGASSGSPAASSCATASRSTCSASPSTTPACRSSCRTSAPASSARR